MQKLYKKYAKGIDNLFSFCYNVIMKSFSKEDLLYFIQKNYGLKGLIAKDLGITKAELDKLLKGKGLEEEPDNAFDVVIEEIEHKVLTEAINGDVKLGMSILEKLSDKYKGKQQVDFNHNIQIYLPKPDNELFNRIKVMEDSNIIKGKLLEG